MITVPDFNKMKAIQEEFEDVLLRISDLMRGVSTVSNAERSRLELADTLEYAQHLMDEWSHAVDEGCWRQLH